MTGLLEDWAGRVGWTVAPCNVLVEGTSDVALTSLAAELYRQQHGGPPLVGGDIAIIAAGRRDDGGVDGVNRRLSAARQVADFDRAANGSLRHRFIGLFDNDRAGRRAMTRACDFDRRLHRYRDLFLLHPIMPPAAGADAATVQERARQLNAPHQDLDWEVEDLISDRLIMAFDQAHPGSIISSVSRNGFTHHEYTPDGKRLLGRYVRANARLDDLEGCIRLIVALRDYLSLAIDHIVY